MCISGTFKNSKLWVSIVDAIMTFDKMFKILPPSNIM